MKKSELNQIKKEIESIMNDLSLNIEYSEDKKILISDFKKNEILSYLDNELSENIQDEIFEKKIQIHQKKDENIKIDMIKLDNYNLKLIYHRRRDNSLEYRIFISYKDENNHLKRKRYINDSIKKIHNDEDKMKDYLYKIKKNQISEFLKIS